MMILYFAVAILIQFTLKLKIGVFHYSMQLLPTHMAMVLIIRNYAMTIY